MLPSMHESDRIESCQRHTAAIVGSGRGDSRGVDRRKDLRHAAALGGAAFGMDNPTIRSASIQFAPLGATGEPERDSGTNRETTVGATGAVDAIDRAAIGSASRETAGALWVGTRPMGRPHVGTAFK